MLNGFQEFIKQTVQGNGKKREARQSKRLSDGEPSAKVKRSALEDISNKGKNNSGLIRIDRNATINAKTAAQEKPAAGKGQLRRSASTLPSISSSRHEVNNQQDEKIKPQYSPRFDAVDLTSSETLTREDSNVITPMEVEEDTLQITRPTPPFDIDVEVEDDPQYCTTYVHEIFDYLSISERKYQPADYMAMQTDITAHMRAILVDWLVDVADEYKLCAETLFLAVNYLDRYLSAKPVLRGRLQLMGVVCMLIASKYEEVYAPPVDEFVYISDNTYTKEEIFEMEGAVLTLLQFNLTVPSMRTFLRRFLRAAHADDTMSLLASYLCELSLMEYSFIKYLPSRVAAAAVSIALHTFGFTAWTPALEYYSGIVMDAEQKQCVRELHAVHTRAHQGALTATREKYATPQNLRVSLMAATATPPPV